MRPRMRGEACSTTMVRFIDMPTDEMKPTAPTVTIAQNSVLETAMPIRAPPRAKS